jgi:hypothetical protein
MNWKTLPMPQTTIAPQIHESFNVHGYDAAKIPFHLIISVDHFANLQSLPFGKLEDPFGIWYTDFLAYAT